LGVTRMQFIDYCVNMLLNAADPYVPAGELAKPE
jgi:hypothetical protein